jgi:hypothetical protein
MEEKNEHHFEEKKNSNANLALDSQLSFDKNKNGAMINLKLILIILNLTFFFLRLSYRALNRKK